MKCLFIGGSNDGKQIYVRDAQERPEVTLLMDAKQSRLGVNAEKYFPHRISAGGKEILVFAIDGMTMADTIEQLVEGYRAL
jgi:hypothetical protein